MDHAHFDDLTRTVGDGGTRRAIFRLLAGGALGAVSVRLGLTETGEAKAKQNRDARKSHKPQAERQKKGPVQTEGKRRKKRDRNRDKKKDPKVVECYSDRACGPCQRCVGGSCIDLAPLCDPDACQQEFCNPETNSWECRSTCELAESVCCKGECFSPCSNGCDVNETCDACDQPPSEKEYCPGNDTCVEGCPRGERWNPVFCQCENCDVQCDPETGAMESVGCLPSEACNGGRCQSWCPPGTKTCAFWKNYGDGRSTVEYQCILADWTCTSSGGCPPDTECHVDSNCNQPQR